MAKDLHTTALYGEIGHGYPHFLFHFFNVLSVVNNCAKKRAKVLITTSFSMESP